MKIKGYFPLITSDVASIDRASFRWERSVRLVQRRNLSLSPTVETASLFQHGWNFLAATSGSWIHPFAAASTRLLWLSLILLATFLAATPARAAGEGQERGTESFSGDVLCRPLRSELPSSDCLMMGPAAYVARMNRLGLTFPPRPFTGQPPDPSLTWIDVRYGQVVQPNAPVYGSLEDAVKRGNVIRRIDSPYSFISYTEEAVVDGKRFYMVDYGGWMTANEISRIGSPSLFQGVSFKRTPHLPFGWILYPVRVQRTPGPGNEDLTGRELFRYEVVQVYATERIEEMDWYLVGPDEWIPEFQGFQRLIGRVIPNPVPPEGVDNGRWLEVNLYEQTISVYDQGQLVFATLTASGIEPFWTRPGLFQIYDKLNATPMRGAFEADRSDAYYLEDVPWTMYYDKARALHGAYWHNSFGSVRSHGCVNLSVGDARWLFDWATEGDWVYVWDPSGITPTDPSFYGDGGA
jgi:hypothetical protein